MTSLLLTTFRSLACRPAGGISSRLGCHIVNHRRGNAVPWATCQQIRFASGEKDNYDDDHYAALGVKPSDPIEKIRKVGNALRMKTHSDHNEGIRNTKFYEVNAATRILGNPVKKAIYDPIWSAKYGKAQATAAAGRREADTLRAATLAKDLARRREEMRRAAEAANAEETKRRDEERKARKREKREAQKAEAERQWKATEEERKENERIAAIKAAEKAAEKKKADQETARRKADAAARAAALRKAREDELARQREREARMVVLRHVPIGARLFDVLRGLDPLSPGPILDFGLEGGTVWVEFWTAEEAQALRRVVTQTEQCIILGKTIKTASIYQGRTKVPEGPDFISRCLYIAAPLAFLDGESELHRVVEWKLKKKGFTKKPIALSPEGATPTGRWVQADYQSVAAAQSAKAALEKHFPELEVMYIRDHCEGVGPTAQGGAGVDSESRKKASDSWLSTVFEYFGFVVAFSVIAGLIEIWLGKSSDRDAQQKKQDR